MHLLLYRHGAINYIRTKFFNSPNNTIMKTIKSTITICLFCSFILAIPKTVLSQDERKVTGCYINLNGDTSKGFFPHYKEWDYNPSKVSFVAANATEEIILTTSNCRSFQMDNNEAYIAYSGTCLANPLEINATYQQADSSNKIVQVNTFLRVIFDKNNFKLLLLNRRERNTFFYQVQQEPVTELIYKNYIDNMRVIEVLTYKNQLSMLFDKQIVQNKLSRNLEELTYKENSLVVFLERVMEAGKIKRKKQKYRSSFFATAGMAFNSLDPVQNYSSYTALTHFNNSVSPAINIGVFIPFQRNFGRIFFSPQLRVYSLKHTGEYITPFNNGSQKISTTFKSNLCLASSLYIGYTVLRNKIIEWNIAAGVGLLYLSNFKRTVNTDAYPAENTTENPLMLTPNLQSSLVFNRNIMFTAYYAYPSTGTTGYGIAPKTIQLTIGWRFNR